MKKRRSADRWDRKLCRSLALAVIFAGGAGACLPAMASAADPLTGVQSVVSSDGVAVSEDVSGGSLTVSGSYAAGAMGGYSCAVSIAGDNATSGSASKNTLTLTADSDYGSSGTAYGGLSCAEDGTSGDYVTSSGDASENTVDILGGTLGDVYGGCSAADSSTDTVSGAANSNTVNIKGSAKITGDVYGGNSDSSANFFTATAGETSKNTVNITENAAITGNVYGGSSYSYVNRYYGAVVPAAVTGNALNNTINITGNTTITGNVYGGSSVAICYYGAAASGNASNNTINISGSATIIGEVYGGYSNAQGDTTLVSGDASDNIINIQGTPDLTQAWLYGGTSWTYGSEDSTCGATTGNTLNLYTSALTVANISDFQNINFCVSASALGSGTLLTITGGSETDLQDAAIQVVLPSGSSLAAADTISLIENTAGIVNAAATASLDTSDVAYDGLLSLSVADGTLTGTVTSVTAAKTAPTTGSTAVNLLAADSTVTRAVDGSVYGAYSADGTSSTGTVAYDGGTNAIGQNLYGAYSYGTGAVATGSQVTLISGTVSGNLVGGAAVSSDDTSASATGNTVTLEGGTVNGDVYGGYSSNGSATDNIVNLYGGLITGTIYGGSGTTVSGNTLNVYGSSLTAGNIANFANINFYLPATLISGDTILTLNGGSATNLSGTAINAGISGSASVQVGDTITLLKNDSGLTTDAATTYGTLTQGVSVEYGLTITKSDDTTITATVTAASGSDGSSSNAGSTTTLKAQTKSFAETRAGTASFLNGLGDTLASTGIGNAVSAAQASDTGFSDGTTASGATPAAGNASGGTTDSGQDSAKAQTAAAKAASKSAGPSAGGFAPFAAIGGSSLRAHSGSYVDSHGVNMNLGLSRAIPQRDGILTFGPLIEYGIGSYDSYLDDGTHGSGDTHSFGLGAFIRKDRKDGLWYEGSLRAGRISTDYHSVMDDTAVSYDTSSHYYAAHLGLGHITRLKKRDSLDVYGKYFYTHQTGTSADLSTGEHYDFSAVNSSRLRLGTRYTHGVNDQSAIYAGLAYEYEFAGDARATYNGMSTPSPSIKGGSGFVELGWRVKPASGSPLTIDLGLNYWQGKHEGLTANAGLEWKF